jgi:hypothetical protein
MHLVLRSTKAKGEWSFRRPRNEAHVNRIVEKFSVIYGVRVISMANVGNHLHLQIKLANRFTYKPFIRAITSAIAMAITGRSRWTKSTAESSVTKRPSNGTNNSSQSKREKFWDYRPFTRVVESFKAWLNLKDYIRINSFEGAGYKRDDARYMLAVERRLDAEAEIFPEN